MSLPSTLARFHYLTLTAACVCLIVALQPHLPAVGPYLWPLAMLTLLAGRVEGRWILPGWLANGLALLVAGVGFAWVYQATPDLSERPGALIPYLGPLLLVLLVLRLYQARGWRDRWVLQGIGLIQVALACALTTSLLFGLLLLLYLLLALPLLALSQLDDARRRAGLAGGAVPTPRLGGRTLLWGLGALGIALLLFLLAPRLAWQSWDPFRQLGFQSPSPRPAGDFFTQKIDLNVTGRVTLGTEEAFRVTVLAGPAGGSRGRLPAAPRWRTAVLDRYTEGTWLVVPTGVPRHVVPQEHLPDLGPDQVVLRFAVNPRAAGGLVLADPILFADGPLRYPVALAGPTPVSFREAAGTLQYAGGQRVGLASYRQVTRPLLSRWPLILPPSTDPARAVRFLSEHLLRDVPAGLAQWTDQRLAELAATGRYGLDADALQRGDQARIAQALTAYLATSGQYTYTLDLRREDEPDPVLDFLKNVKQGHCERFAGALALMLRSQGIPARVVRGYRGAEPLGADQYAVHQKDAHAWVEALVPAEGGPGLDWLSLDATPASDESEGPSLGATLWSYWEAFSRWQESVWRDLIVGYGAGQQAALWQEWLFKWGLPQILLWIGAAAVALLGLILLVRWLRRWAARPRPPGPASSLPVLRRLWELLVRAGLLDFDPSRTPRELATAAGAALAGQAATAPHADLPGRLVELLYRQRFGGRPPAAEELAQADSAVAELAAVLARGEP